MNQHCLIDTTFPDQVKVDVITRGSESLMPYKFPKLNENESSLNGLLREKCLVAQDYRGAFILSYLKQKCTYIEGSVPL